jgi:hypothetical protein
MFVSSITWSITRHPAAARNDGRDRATGREGSDTRSAPSRVKDHRAGRARRPRQPAGCRREAIGARHDPIARSHIFPSARVAIAPDGASSGQSVEKLAVLQIVDRADGDDADAERISATLAAARMVFSQHDGLLAHLGGADRSAQRLAGGRAGRPTRMCGPGERLREPAVRRGFRRRDRCPCGAGSRRCCSRRCCFHPAAGCRSRSTASSSRR